MRKLIIFLLASLPLFSYGQIISGVVSVSARYQHAPVTPPDPPEESDYVPVPDPPAFIDTYTLNHGTTGNNINNSEVGGKTNLLFGGRYDFAQFASLAGLTYKFKSIIDTDPSTWVTLGIVGPSAGFSTVGTIFNYELYNTRIYGTDAGIKITTSVVPKTQLIQNVTIEDPGFAGVQDNVSAAGQNYGSFTAKFVLGLRTGGEMFYLGNTGNQTSTYLGVDTVINCYGEDLGREGVQMNGHTQVYVSNVTMIGDGVNLGEGNGQNNGVQFQNVEHGTLENSLFLNFVSPGMFAVNDFTIRNCYFEWLNPTRNVYMQNMIANGYTKHDYPGGTVTFEHLVYDNPNFTDNVVFLLQDPNTNYVFQDTLWVPASAVDHYQDQRPGGGVGSITDNAVWIETNSPRRPILTRPPEDERVGFEQVVDKTNYWYLIGAGHRTPEP